MSSKPASQACPSLPDELWTRVLSYLENPSQIASASQVITTWHKDTVSHVFESVWRRIWDTTASLPSSTLLDTPFLRVPGSWRHQVAASYRLERLDKARILYLPPRYDTLGDVHPEDRLNISPCTNDLEDVLGRALHAHAFAQVVVIAFERGVGLLRQKVHPLRGKPIHRRRPRADTPSLYYDDASHLHGIQMLAPASLKSGTVLAVTHDNLVRIDLQSNRHQPFTWRVIDSFLDVGTPLKLTASTDSRYGAVGFCTGVVRIVSLSGGCRFSFQLPEEAEHLALNEKWAIAANSFQPIAMSVWDLTAGNLHASFTQASLEWINVYVVAGIAATNNPDQFIVWDGRNTIRFFDIPTKSFVRTIEVRSRFVREPRSVTEEAEHGAGSPHLGRGKMVLSADRQNVALATSNRVMVISLRADKMYGTAPQLDRARRAVLGMSTDDRLIVTAESNAYGSLHTKVSGRVAIAVKPKLQVWDVQHEAIRCELELPCPATALSVCGDTVAIVCGAVGQVMVAFANPSAREPQTLLPTM